MWNLSYHKKDLCGSVNVWQSKIVLYCNGFYDDLKERLTIKWKIGGIIK